MNKMMLKKQTVWLLTMLSLVVVLSVYYVFSDPQGEDIAKLTEEKQAEQEKEASSDKNEADISTEEAGSEAFEALRMEMNDERSKMRSDLTEQVASTELSSEEKLKVYEKIQSLNEASTKERLLESFIKTMGYEDALVRADDSKVRITIKADEHDEEAANEIIRLVHDEVGDLQVVAVEFQNDK